MPTTSTWRQRAASRRDAAGAYYPVSSKGDSDFVFEPMIRRQTSPNYSWEHALGDAGAAHQPGLTAVDAVGHWRRVGD
jgi:hypothetical protein